LRYGFTGYFRVHLNELLRGRTGGGGQQGDHRPSWKRASMGAFRLAEARTRPWVHSSGRLVMSTRSSLDLALSCICLSKKEWMPPPSIIW
jgi:hypothetical protein